MRHTRQNIILLLSGLLFLSVAMADDMKITVFSVANETSIGYIDAKDTSDGLLLTPHFSQLPPGLHGMHIHENPSCGHQAADAGSHWDPKMSQKHEGPYKPGHLGDLPALFVDTHGNAALPVLAPDLTVKDLHGHSLMIHAGGDDYSDTPQLGGGGARIACGVID